MRLHREHVRHAHRRRADERHRAVPHVGRVLEAADRLERPAAAAVHVAVRAVLAVHLGGDDARVAGDGRRRAVPGHRRVLAGERVQPPEVRLDEVGAAVDGELDRAGSAVEHADRRRELDARHRQHRVEEPALVLLRRREVEGEPRVTVLEAAVDVPVSHRSVAPFVDVDERRAECRVLRSVGFSPMASNLSPHHPLVIAGNLPARRLLRARRSPHVVSTVYGATIQRIISGNPQVPKQYSRHRSRRQRRMCHWMRSLDRDRQ